MLRTLCRIAMKAPDGHQGVEIDETKPTRDIDVLWQQGFKFDHGREREDERSQMGGARHSLGRHGSGEWSGGGPGTTFDLRGRSGRADREKRSQRNKANVAYLYAFMSTV